MKFKTLKHKTLPDTFGHIIDVPNEDTGIHQWEIAHGDIPLLQPMTATMEMAIKYWMKQKNTEELLKQLMDYEMVEVEIKVI